MTLSEACNVLHIDEGHNDDLVEALLEAVPTYILLTTGLSLEDQENEPLVNTVTGFLITQWFYRDHADDSSLTRTINSLLKVISLKAREYNNG